MPLCTRHFCSTDVFFGGIGAASRSGILVKGGNYLDALNHLGAVVFDKTGTLTVGNFNVTAIEAQSPYTKDDVLNAALTAEQMSNHPIARSISACAKSHGMMCNSNDISKNNYTELSGRGVKCTIGDDIIYAGNEKLMREIGISYMPSSQFGTLVYVAKTINTSVAYRSATKSKAMPKTPYRICANAA